MTPEWEHAKRLFYKMFDYPLYTPELEQALDEHDKALELAFKSDEREK